jgi:hypothetical protein
LPAHLETGEKASLPPRARVSVSIFVEWAVMLAAYLCSFDRQRRPAELRRCFLTAPGFARSNAIKSISDSDTGRSQFAASIESANATESDQLKVSQAFT